MLETDSNSLSNKSAKFRFNIQRTEITTVRASPYSQMKRERRNIQVRPLTLLCAFQMGQPRPLLTSLSMPSQLRCYEWKKN